MAVVREDVVKIGFDIDDGPLSRLTKDLGGVSSEIKDNLGKDSFKGLANSAKTASGDVKGLANNTQTASGKVKQLAQTSMSKLKSGLQTVKTKLTEIAKKAGAAALKMLKKIAAVSLKGLLAGLGALTTGLGMIIFKASQAYADFEQLTGGVQKLFGAGGMSIEEYANSVGKSVGEVQDKYNSLIAAEKAVMQNANNGWKTAGLSANEYIDTVTSFSASLITSLGGDTKKAAELADMAIGDMADNANVFGTDMATVQQVYQGLAKDQYVLLDNLKLGYGGTKEGAKQLVADAAKIDKSIKANDLSFSNMVKAINVVQKNMGIYGTTAKEAEKTVTGSLSAMKASWSNLLTAIGTGENLDQCFENMIESAEKFGNNISPVIERAVTNLGVIIDKATPIIAQKLPTIIQTILPPLVTAAGTLLGSLVAALPSIISTLIPAIKEAAGEIVRGLYEGLTGKEMDEDTFSDIQNKINGVVEVAKYAVPIILGLVGAFKAFNTIKTIVNSIKSFATSISNIANTVSGGLSTRLTTTATAMNTTGTAASSSGKKMGTSAKSFLKVGVAILAIGGGLMLAGLGFALLAQSAIALAGAGGGAIAVMAGFVVVIALLAIGAAALGTALTAGAVGFLAFGAALVLAGAAALLFALAVKIITPPLLELIPVVGNVVNTIVNSIGTVLVECIQTAGDAIKGIFESIGTTISTVVTSISDGISSVVDSIGNAVKNVLDGVANVIESIGTSAKNAGEGFKLAAEGLQILAGLSIGDLIKGLTALADGMKTLTQNSAQAAQLGQGMQQFVASLTKMVQLPNTFSTQISTLAESTSTAMSSCVTIVANAMSSITSTISETDLSKSGAYVIDGLIKGMNSKKSEAVAAARAIAQAINVEFDKIQKIASPSKLWAQKGKFLPQGLIGGMESMMPAVRKTTQKVAEVAIPYGNSYSSENSTTYSNNRSSSTEHNTYAPVFNFNIDGSGDTRATARAVKQAAKEAVQEVFESMNRRTPQFT